MVAGEFLAGQQGVDETKPLLRPSHMAMATARLSSTTETAEYESAGCRAV